MGARQCIERAIDVLFCRKSRNYDEIGDDVERQDLLQQQNYDEQLRNDQSNRSKVGEILVSIYIGNLLDEQVDAIVCATTAYLDHSSGLAKAVADAAGYHVMRDCQQFGRPLYACEAMHTSSGDLRPRIKHVIHVLAPAAREYSNENDLRNAVLRTFYNCLRYANDILRAKSVAIPALCTGHFGVSRRTAAEAACEAVLKFDNDVTRARSITEVRFVNIDPEANKLFEETFESSRRYPTARQFQLSFRRPEHRPPHTEISEVSEAPVSPRPRERKLAKNHNAESAERRSPVDKPVDCGHERPHLDDVNYGEVNERSKIVHADVAASGVLVDIDEPSTTHSNSPSIISRKPDEENCVICMGTMTNKRLLPCGHSFCGECIQQSFDMCGAKCPSCGRLYGVQRGNQPPGKMTHMIDHNRHLAGYYGYGTIAITYYIPDGIQNDDHPNPGQPYSGTHRTAFLPNNDEGQEVLGLLRQAFDAGLVFTVGRSVTTGAENVVVWNDIHHKTNDTGPYGYPDPTYLTRIKSELAAKGITVSN